MGVDIILSDSLFVFIGVLYYIYNKVIKSSCCEIGKETKV